MLVVLISATSQAAETPQQPSQERYVYLRSAYVEELKGSDLPVSGNRLTAHFLQFKDEFALFSLSKMTGTTVYIPKSQILFMVQPTDIY
jgi:hypothetical protein